MLFDKEGILNFGGLLVTDYNSIAEMASHGIAPLKEASVRALKAGTDMDMVSCGFLNTLEESLKEGKIMEDQIVTDDELTNQANLVVNLLKKLEQTLSPGQLSEVENLLAEMSVLYAIHQYKEIQDLKL